MKRAFLTDLGITDSDTIKKIIDFHQGVVQDLKDDLSTANSTLKAAQNDLKTAKKTIDDLKTKPADSNSDGKDWKTEYENLSKTVSDKDGKTWKEKYDALNGEFDTYKQTITNKEATVAKQTAVRKHLQADGANPKMIDLLELKFDIAKLELDGEKIKDWVNLSKPVKEQYADVFGEVKEKGTDSVTPPASPRQTFTLDQIKKMSPQEINKNWDAVQETLKKGN